MRYVVSACLAGVECRYGGGGAPHARVLELVRAGEALPVCPEVLGGLGVPRPPCELVNGRARTLDGRDCHDAYRTGAAEALRQAREAGCTVAVLKARSPSCGAGCVYDGTFTHTRIPGDGVFAALLREAGFVLLTEEELQPEGTRSLMEGGDVAWPQSDFRAFPPGGSAAVGGAPAARRDASSELCPPGEDDFSRKGPEPPTQVAEMRKSRPGCGCAAPSESDFRAFPPGGSAAVGGAPAARRDASSV